MDCPGRPRRLWEETLDYGIARILSGLFESLAEADQGSVCSVEF